MKIKTYYPVLGGGCIGVGVGLLASNIIIGGISAGLIMLGILFMIHYYR